MSSALFLQLQDRYEKNIQKVKDDFEKECEKRCLSLMQSMKTLRITEVNCCMGSYFFHGDDVPIVYDDDSKGKKTIMDLAYFLRDFHIERSLGDYYIGWECWKPVKVSRKDINFFIEIISICDLLVRENIPMVVRIDTNKD